MTALAGLAATAGSAIRWDQLHLSPVALDLGVVQLRWYALSYMAMLLIGWWFVLKLVRKPGAPMTAAQVDSLVIWITLGVIAGGRLGWCLFYNPGIWATPLDVLKLWQGGMSFHGGFIGVILALWLFCRRHKLSLLPVRRC